MYVQLRLFKGIVMAQKEKKQMSCYFTAEERRVIEQLADRLERKDSQVVQFGVRMLHRFLKQNPDEALKLTQPFAGQEC